jgi:hypothetical protein
MKGKRRAAEEVLAALKDRTSLSDLEWMAQIGAQHVITMQERQRDYKAKNPSHHRDKAVAWKAEHHHRHRLNTEIGALRTAIQRLIEKPANPNGVDWPARREQYTRDLLDRYIERFEKYGVR